MAPSDKATLEITKRLQNARLNLLRKQPFYALLLMHMKFALDKSCECSYTDGARIAFNPDFLEETDDSELEFVLMHNVLHAALGHPFRVQADYDLEVYDKACDIVVNSNILYSFGMDTGKITLKKYGEMEHLTPSGKEGYEFTLEQVYGELMKEYAKEKKNKKSASKQNAGASKSKESHDGTASKEKSGGSLDSAGSAGSSPLEELKATIFARNQAITEALAKSNVLEEIESETPHNPWLDDHSYWEGDDEDNSQQASWQDRVMRATDVIMEKEDAHVGFGGPPLCAKHLVKELREPEVDWRELLNTFVQEDINDYSFAPPDKRMDDCPFFLPDFNEKDESVKNIWFLIDTSGSIGDKKISAAYSEIISAMEAFNNKLEGLLSFTEVFVTDPLPFCSPEELLDIIPVGGGGTDFGEIFRYMQKNMTDNLPASIVILTDGYDTYPKEEEALGIPVLWLINNENATPPPWGKYARFKVNEPTKG